MDLKQKLDAIREETEQIRADESIATSYQFYQELILQLNSIVEDLKENKNEQNLVTIVTSIEDLVVPYTKAEPEDISKDGKPDEKPEFTYGIYTELRNKGKTHDETKKIGEENYTIKNSKGLGRWAAAYKKRKESLQEKPIQELPEKIVEKIKSGNFGADDYIWNIDNGEIQEDALKAKFLELGKGRTYRGIKSGVAKKYKNFERDLRASGQNSMQYQNGGGRILEFGFDSAGKFYSKKIEDAVREHNLDGKIKI